MTKKGGKKTVILLFVQAQRSLEHVYTSHVSHRCSTSPGVTHAPAARASRQVPSMFKTRLVCRRHGREGVVEGGRQVDGNFLTLQERDSENSDREGGQTESIPPPIRVPSFKVGHMFRHTLCWKI